MRIAKNLRNLGLLCQWQFTRQLQLMPLLVVVQIFMSLATIFGYKMLIGDVTPEMGIYLATGAPTINLMMVGLVMAPQWLGQSKTEGSFDWMRTLPLPRSLFLISDLLIWTLIVLPGTVLGILIGAWQFDVTLSPTWWLVPAALLVALTSAAIGYFMASTLPPSLAQLMTQVLVFVVLLFSPISYPASRMPEWLQEVHHWLPFEPMAELIRAELVSADFSIALRPVLVLLAWCAVSLTVSAAALRRRL